MKRKYKVLAVILVLVGILFSVCSRETDRKFNEVSDEEMSIKQMADSNMSKEDFVINFFPLAYDVAQNYKSDFELNAENISIILCAIVINETSAEGSDGKYYPMKTDKAKQNNLYGLGIAYSYQDATNNWFKNLEASMVDDENRQPVKRYSMVYSSETIKDFCNALGVCGYATDEKFGEKVYEIAIEVKSYLTACELINN